MDYTLIRNDPDKEGKKMQTIYDVQQLLKRFGTIIYLGDRLAEYVLMEQEIRELYHMHMIEVREFQMAVLVLRKHIEIQKAEQKKREG